jgi:ATP/ADP translocase
MCLLLSVGVNHEVSTMGIGPFEASRYEDITAFRMGNIAFWMRTRTLLMRAAIMGTFLTALGCFSGGVCTPLIVITVPLTFLAGVVFYIDLTIALHFPNAYRARAAFEAYTTSPVLSSMSTVELFYWLNMRATGAPLP